VIVEYGFRYGFLAAGIGMVFGQILFNLLAPKYLGDIGVQPSAKNKNLDKDSSAENAPLTKEERDRMTVIYIVCVFVTFFWAGFEQAGSSLTLYTDKFIDRQIGSFLVPTSAFQSVNAFFIVALGGVAAALWLSLAKKGRDLSIPVKMGVGMILLGVGFLFMIGAVFSRGGDIADSSIKAPMIFLIATYFFHTIGELCLSPIGLSMITRLAPVKYASMMMGVWFLSPFIAQVAGGYIAAYVEKLGALYIFELIAAFVIVAGLVLIGLSKMLNRMMHGRG
jgi:POT family proton-dependent oligopeptide transporter